MIDDAARADAKKEYDEAKMTAARESMRSFIASRTNEVRAALSCIDGDQPAIGGCAGTVAVNLTNNQCAEAVPDKDYVARNGNVVAVSGFTLRPVARGTQVVAHHAGKCIAVAPLNPRRRRLVQVACASAAAQTWRVQRSIYR